jgi:hypothetical protein
VRPPSTGGRAGPDIRTADDRELRHLRGHRVGGRKAMSAENIVGLVLAILVTIYMVIALVFPEKF